MPSRLRLFTGIAPPDKIRQTLGEAYSWMGRHEKSLKIVPPSNFHITLKFLGPVESSAVRDLQRELEKAAANQASFELVLTGKGVFPLLGGPQVYWAGVVHSKELTQLAAQIDEATASLGFPKEERPYHPHVTLARADEKKTSNEFRREWSERGDGFEPLRFRADAVTLFESRTLPQGPVYQAIAAFPLFS